MLGVGQREAEAHEQMFVEYDKKQGSPALKSKMGRQEPWIANMRHHSDSYIMQADKMAAEAERFGEFHRMRGEEMREEQAGRTEECHEATSGERI